MAKRTILIIVGIIFYIILLILDIGLGIFTAIFDIPILAGLSKSLGETLIEGLSLAIVLFLAFAGGKK